MIERFIGCTLWYSIGNGGDGSAYLRWFKTKESASLDQDNMSEGWGEPCYGSIDSFVGSKEYVEAEKNEIAIENFSKLLNGVIFYLDGRKCQVKNAEKQKYEDFETGEIVYIYNDEYEQISFEEPEIFDEEEEG